MAPKRPVLSCIVRAFGGTYLRFYGVVGANTYGTAEAVPYISENFLREDFFPQGLDYMPLAPEALSG